MKLASSVVLAALLAPAIAAAQPSQSPPPGPPPPPPSYGGGGYYSAPPATEPGGFMNRRGRLAVGFGLGLGGMSAEKANLDCPSCDYDPVAAGIDFHIGGMLTSRLALLFEIQANGQTLEDFGDGTQTLTQAAILGAAQFWVTPRLWIKGGLGVANLQQTYSDYYDDHDEDLGSGGAVLLAAGVELLQGRNFALDLQGRVLAATYGEDSIDDTVTAATIGVGFNWY